MRGSLVLGGLSTLLFLTGAAFAEASGGNPLPVAFTVTTSANKNLFWNDQPVLNVHVENHGSEPVPLLRYELHVQDEYSQQETWSVRDVFQDVPAGGALDKAETVAVPYGAFRVAWSLSMVTRQAGGAAPLIAEVSKGSLDVSRMMPPCYRDAPEAVRAYDRRWSIFGGVFASHAPDLAADMGMRWNRYEETEWPNYEREPGRFDMQPLIDGVRKWKKAGVECIVFQTLYQRPAFYNPDQPGFARAFGIVMGHAAEAVRGLSDAFELGNEDNGPTKMLYSEVARHGAAAIRAAQPGAFIANSGTASVDLGWLCMQAARGVTDVLDVLCTHPYTVNDSPETWKIYDRLGQMDDLIDRIGGMKLQWTTAFGWPHDFNAQRRAEWIPRQFIIGAAAGIERHGLYTSERDDGVHQGAAAGPGFVPAGVSVHALAKQIEGHRFAGLIRHDDELWMAVFEQAGKPLAVGWSPSGNAQWSVAVTDGYRVLDLFGNALPVQAQGGAITVHATGAPVYVAGVADAVLQEASANQCRHEQERFAKCVKAASLPENHPWATLAARPDASAADLRQALLQWTPGATPIALPEQAMVAQVLRWYWIAGRRGDAGAEAPSAEPLDARRAALRKRLDASVAQDADIPSLRYLLNRWDRLVDEAAVADVSGAPDLARRLRVMQDTVAQLCERFAEHGGRVLYSIWPYLCTVAKDGTLQERLRFVPGEATAIKVRINSYSRVERPVVVSFQVPDGWKAEPETVSAIARPGQGAEAEIRVRCPQDAASAKPAIRAQLHVEGLGDRVVPFDDAVIDAVPTGAK